MRIEDCWEDKIVYYISFLTLDDRKIFVTIFLPIEVTKKQDIIKIIMANFNNVKKVLTIDDWGSGLLLKD
ncbi:hypothetical protein RAK27_18855 [Carnobacterium maltaromaticum]|uniref:Uncharacterized protein n=1 Tax=Carnobacterium maltaromaticum TaxID=2751 RepID=A0AAW9K4J2_CARML|nr:hypothetical protein [Carnobacterium maltaromaticum]MDZ5760706.1 hypothetical protein [Carnobacterium maltaromaticum]